MPWDADDDPIIYRPRPPQDPPVTALTGYCPVLRRAGDLTPAQWQQAWAEMTFGTWRRALELKTGQPQPPAIAYCLNLSDVPFAPPSPETTILPQPLEQWPVMDCLWALFVLNRIVSPRKFLRSVAAAMQPGGILALSFAAWGADGEDCAAGHERRTRIYQTTATQALIREDAHPCELRVFGGTDWRYRGDACGEYTIGTLVLQKVKFEGV